MSDPQLQLVDFHCHHVPPDLLTSQPQPDTPAAARTRRLLTDLDALLHGTDGADVDQRVVSIPAEQFAPAGRPPAATQLQRNNDCLAELVQRHRGRLLGLATVDAFSGTGGADEVRRAHRDLGLRGIFVESAQGDLLLDAPQAQPALEAAAALRMPVFVHPINPTGLTERMAPFGRLGQRFARGTVNGATLLALLEGGTFDALPDLQIVVTTLAIGGVLLASAFGDPPRLRAGTAEALRRHVYIDTMGFDAALIRATVSLLGADHVLLGSDWPIDAAPIRARALAAFAAAGLDDAEQALIAHGNARRLLAAG
ncbi:amidohydrolase family protein [Chitinasiproducens palmae]|uniref:Aminocarboxymuconate-semialdehyde decarboxylase n=1 Tax=Chitinasiproducens palmae TaxID=1770053 RepID=A0A1H2PQ57_9BURK|nr:amidohydrolase family protein [Chitinasiproducens palmae]SDV48862.1 aminocarboxymuconate-semialdehyde decarboxylase [Chitinasiproducens palmae]